MRLFTALELPDDPREHLVRLIRFWKQNLEYDMIRRLGIDTFSVNWVRDENLHVTLKFLGEVAETDLPSVCQAFESVSTTGSMILNVSHLECLPPRGPVLTLCGGLEGDVGRLAHLYDLVDHACANLGFPRERRAFRPHITLGRLRRALPTMARSVLDKRATEQMPGPSFNATSFALIQSDLLSAGPRYTPLARFPLDSQSI